MIVLHSLERPCLSNLIRAMERLSRVRRLEIIDRGRKAKAAKDRRLRRLTREANAEARRWLASKDSP